MKALVFVPGTMGTELVGAASGEVVWPPAPLETQFGYKRLDKLLGADVKPRNIIERVMCLEFYGTLLDQFAELGFRQGGDKPLHLFPYDWRIDLERTASHLGAKLDAVEGDEIILVAHSMGGLVCRLLLEPPTYAGRPWFRKITTFIALATPHHGAPLALARVLGLDSTLGISKEDFRKLAGDPRYPSGYQLLPAPNEAACWDAGDLTVGALDIYDPVTAQRLGLNSTLLARARFVHDSLGNGSRPGHVRYFYFAGTGHETVTRINVLEHAGSYPPEEMVVTRTEDAGDGTVPFWSALPAAAQKQIVVNEHSTVFRGNPFKRVFYRLLGGDLGSPLEVALAEDESRGLELSIPTPIIHCGQNFELLLVPSEPVAEFAGSVLLQGLRQDGTPAAEPQQVSAVNYTGPRVTRLRWIMPGISEPGLYAIRFAGTPCASEERRFAVVSFGEAQDPQPSATARIPI
jgi:pimeloyl-ACP methyl ester carboxylesterase